MVNIKEAAEKMDRTDEQLMARARSEANRHESPMELFDDLVNEKFLRVKEARDRMRYLQHEYSCTINVKWWEVEYEGQNYECTCGLADHIKAMEELLERPTDKE